METAIEMAMELQLKMRHQHVNREAFSLRLRVKMSQNDGSSQKPRDKTWIQDEQGRQDNGVGRSLPCPLMLGDSVEQQEWNNRPLAEKG